MGPQPLPPAFRTSRLLATGCADAACITSETRPEHCPPERNVAVQRPSRWSGQCPEATLPRPASKLQESCAAEATA